METIAVYWEPIIRTYGFQVQEGLVLSRLRLPVDSLGQWGHALKEMADPGPEFRLVWAQADDAMHLTVYMLSDRIHWCMLQSVWPAPGDQGNERVDLVFFQGPHFGDRYGIMDFTYKALALEKVPLLAAACSVATIYLVLPPGWGSRTRTLLSSAFEIPATVGSGRGKGETKNSGGQA